MFHPLPKQNLQINQVTTNWKRFTLEVDFFFLSSKYTKTTYQITNIRNKFLFNKKEKLCKPKKSHVNTSG